MTTPARVVNSFDQIDKKTGEFKRTVTDFHNTIEVGGQFPPEANRYVLYISYACPWASNRVYTTLALKGLLDVIDVCVVHPVWGYIHKEGEPERKSWVFGDSSHTMQGNSAIQAALDFGKQHPEILSEEDKYFLNNVNIHATEVDGINVTDKYYGAKSLREIYELSESTYVGRYTVPLLFDTQTKKIVNTESAEIIRILDTSFQELAKHPEFTIHPKDVNMDIITAENDRMYNSFNNGVYRAGFAQTQLAYNTAKNEVTEYLDYLDETLKSRRFIAGQSFSESDIRAIATLYRYDPVYVTHFKLASKRIVDYENIYAYLRDVWQNVFTPESHTTFNECHVKYHYYCSHERINPFAVIPYTIPMDLTLTVDRLHVGKTQ